jgi:hypothetical protein
MLFCENQMLPLDKNLALPHPQAGLPGRFFGRVFPVEDKQLAKWQAQLARTQAELAQLGPMRPGSLSQQYKDPVAKTGAYWQLSYTHNMRSRSRYVRPAELPRIKALLANFKHFRELVDRCVDLSVNITDRQTELLRASEPDNP